jgi:hypothetical protein
MPGAKTIKTLGILKVVEKSERQVAVNFGREPSGTFWK